MVECDVRSALEGNGREKKASESEMSIRGCRVAILH